MSKKISFVLLLSVTTLFLSIVIGILIYRVSDTGNRRISTYDQITLQQTEERLKTPETSGKININIATYDELLLLPGIGPTLAERIIERRNNHGEFTEVDELLEINGIGPAKLDGIKDYITVGG